MKLDARQQEQINDVFAVFDTNRDGYLDYGELRFSLRALGFELPKSDTYSYLVRYGIQPPNWDTRRECSPVFREFTLPIWQGIAGTLIHGRDPRSECERAFKLFDVDNKGLITVGDLRRVQHELGQSMEESELESMINEFDAEGKNAINVDEFVKIMLGRKQK